MGLIATSEKRIAMMDVEESRQVHLERFAALGLPTKESEEFRYTDLTPLESMALDTPSVMVPTVPLSRNQIAIWNGRPVLERSRLPSSVKVTVVAPENEVDEESGALAHLNMALVPAIVNIEIEDGTVLADPIEILHFGGERSKTVVSHPRVHVSAGTRTKAIVIERFQGMASEFASWTNAQTTLEIHDSASLSYGRIEMGDRTSWHTGEVYAELGAAATLESFVLAVGAKVQRHGLIVRSAAPGSTVRMYGLSLVEQGQHIDQYTFVDHAVPECGSEQVYKGIVSEGSRSVFHGRILIRKGAQKTNSKQLNKNLLLGPKAEVDTRPQLEISADDVKATHGATVGRLNQDELFYLQARGVSPEKAVSIVARGFAEDAANHFTNDVFKSAMVAEVRDVMSVFKAGLPQ